VSGDYGLGYKVHEDAYCELEEEAERYRLEANAMMLQRDRLAEVAQAVWDRWETPLWKDHPPTALVMNKLRDALTAMEGGQS
jgi:hypothetical protein